MSPTEPSSPQSSATRIVITGVGSCTCAGLTPALWQSLLDMRSHLSPFVRDPVEVAGVVDDSVLAPLEPRTADLLSRHGHLGITAVRECLRNASLDPSLRPSTGLIFCSASQGLDKGELVMRGLEQGNAAVDPAAVQSVFDTGACHLIAAHEHLGGYVHAVQAASCSGMVAIRTAMSAILAGQARRIVCVAGEANLHPGAFLFYSMRARIDGMTCSFYGKAFGRQGREPADYVIPFGPPQVSDRGAIAEAGAAVLIESEQSALERGARILAVIDSATLAFLSDNVHGADPCLQGLRTAIAPILKQPPSSVYMAATGATIIDAGPCTACSESFPGAHVFSAEPVIGHTGAGTSLVNTALAALSIDRNCLLPTRNALGHEPCAGFTLLPSSHPQSLPRNGRIAVVSSGWGGYHGAMALSRHA